MKKEKKGLSIFTIIRERQRVKLQIERMSIRNISTIIKEEEARRRKYGHQQQQVETSDKAYELFFKRYTPLQ